MLHAQGASITKISQNKHTKIEFETPVGRGKLAISTTPSDVRATLNTRSDIHRKIAEISARRESHLDTRDVIQTVGEPALRVRQAPHPARNRDKTPAVRLSATFQYAEENRPPKRAHKKHPAVDPKGKALEALEAMQDFAIRELAAAVERRHPHWESIITADAVGMPYLRDYGTLFRLWTRRAPLEDRCKLLNKRNGFTLALAENAREYADDMPGTQDLINWAHTVVARRAEYKGCELLPFAWPPVLQYFDKEDDKGSEE